MSANELLYTKSHEWVLFSDDKTAKVGLTDYAQKQLGDLVFVNLPSEGDEAEAGAAVADVESVKAVSDVFSPVTGTITAVNEAVLDAPQMINESPYETWLFEVGGITGREEFLTEAQYEELCQKEG
ncbi:MAG TPA: glycine cleavage system protein GcvH [Candidatus Fimivivens faecavium]|nr:glycine cleavage system protein GcvH [Candidatus Fimivivens faecavium]